MTQDTDQPETIALLNGRYELHERLGAGGMAEVFRAEDTILGRTVAIKILRSEAGAVAAPVRAQREVSALSSVTHPSLVTLLEAQIAPHRARYLVMEFIDGPTLAQRLYDGPLPLAEVRHLATELASGLHAMHQAGLIHRDVKPSNILLARASTASGFFRVKLADFGLAQLTDAAAVTTPGMVIGTAAYLAPEQVRGEGCGPASDIYAFGLVLLESITGERAFPHASGIGAVIARLVKSPEIPAGLDRRWSGLLGGMLATDPAQRPTALQVVHALASLPAMVASPAASEEARTQDILPGTTGRQRAHSRPLVDVARLRPVRHRRVRRMPRPLLAIASVAAAGVICASATLTGLAFPLADSPSANVPKAKKIEPPTLPGATTPVAEEPPAIYTVDGPPSPNTESATFTTPKPQQTQRQGPNGNGVQKDAHETQKQDKEAKRQNDKDAAAQQRAADKLAREAARQEKKNG